MIANTLIHREYTSSYQAKFLIENNRMYVENANRSVQSGMITPKNMEPNPKNPIIASFFRNIGYADQLGSGVRNLFKYSKYYSGEEPEFIEDDTFRIIVPLNSDYLDSNFKNDILPVPATQSVANTTQLATQSIDMAVQMKNAKLEKDIIAMIEFEPRLSQRQIAERLERNVNTIKYYMRKIHEQGILEHIGSSQKGKWIVRGETQSK